MISSIKIAVFGKTNRKDILLILFCLVLFSGFVYQGFITHEAGNFFPR